MQPRILWFREEKPDWGIETEIISHTQEYSVVKATIKDEKGRVIADGIKSETAKGFADHLEKAQSGAIGRALGFVGYGTLFATELDEGDRLADSPQAPTAHFNSVPIPDQYYSQTQEQEEITPEVITEKQAKRLFAIAKTKGLSNDAIKDILSVYGYQSSKDINWKDYTKIIKAIESA